MDNTGQVPNLDAAACRVRQDRLREQLICRQLDAALITDPRHVFYFTNYWCRAVFTRLALVHANGPCILLAPLPIGADQPGNLAADEVVEFPSNQIGTLVEDQTAAAVRAIAAHLNRCRRIGSDRLRAGLLPQAEVDDLHGVLLALRRRKDADEVDMLRFAIAAAEAAYAWAFDNLRPGADEVELFAGMQAAAANHVGEAIGEFGNDFQIGSFGSAPRRRRCQAGEMAIFDLSVVVRGYSSDMCRSFVVGGQPTELQTAAHGRVLEVLQQVEQAIRPGASCRRLYDEAHAQLQGYQGWSFMHHLGHGIGLDAHEAPRLNPHWDDTLEKGDVIAVEPGLYGDDLRPGLRIEQVYRVGPSGAEMLSRFPTALS